MNKKMIAWAVGALFSIHFTASPVVAQTRPSSASTAVVSFSGAAIGDIKKKKKVDTDFKSAKAACQSLKSMERTSCLKEAKATHRQARFDNRATRRTADKSPVAASQDLPAVQTQSAAVSATGIAPSAVGPNRTPGKPAFPEK